MNMAFRAVAVAVASDNATGPASYQRRQGHPFRTTCVLMIPAANTDVATGCPIAEVVGFLFRLRCESVRV